METVVVDHSRLGHMQGPGVLDATHLRAAGLGGEGNVHQQWARMASMDCFTTATLPALVPLDPGKHVNYTPGMVLGVDDFTQEFAYLANRDEWRARDAVGYGTLRGLAAEVVQDPATLRWTVRVAAGSA